MACLHAALAESPRLPTYQPREGDLVFQSLPHCPLVDVIEGCTHSPFSHCGIMHKGESGWMVIEAIGPVKQTAWDFWRLQGRGEAFAVKRWKAQDAGVIVGFVAAALEFSGKPYDVHYSMDDEAIYCSELIYKAYLKATGKKLGHLVKLGELDWQPHEIVIKAIEGRVPVEREMITPVALFEAAELEDAEGGTLKQPKP